MEKEFEVGKTYRSKKIDPIITETGIKGAYWGVWKEGNKYYYELDIGHFASRLVTVEITKEDFNYMMSGSMAEDDILERERELMFKYNPNRHPEIKIVKDSWKKGSKEDT